MNPTKYLKAIAAIVLGALGSAYFALNDNTITPQEWVQMAQVAITAGATVYGLPNFAPTTLPVEFDPFPTEDKTEARHSA